MNDEEKTYKKLIEDLKSLPKVEAPKDFEIKLWRKINSSEETPKIDFWEKLLSPAKLAPAAIAIVSAVIIFFVVDINSEEVEDPLNIAPRLREDLVLLETTQEVPIELGKKSVRQKDRAEKHSEGLLSEKKDIQPPLPKAMNDEVGSELETKASDLLVSDKLETGISDSVGYRSDDVKNLDESVAPAAITTTTNEIKKNNLNFMQRNLSTEEKKEVQQLKMKVQTEKSVKTQQNSNKLP